MKVEPPTSTLRESLSRTLSAAPPTKAMMTTQLQEETACGYALIRVPCPTTAVLLENELFEARSISLNELKMFKAYFDNTYFANLFSHYIYYSIGFSNLHL
jgi:hypothetical protein